MSETPWIGILVALLGGGAMGAIIKILFDLRQGRVQTISKRLKIFPLFHHETPYQGLTAVVSVTHDGATTEYRNLFIADLTVKNRSNKDLGEFEFGVALHGGECIHAAWEDPDQHHTLSLVEPVSPSSPKSALKLCAKPFNRTDAYSLRLYLTSGREGQKPATPKLTSPYPVRFLDESEPGARRSSIIAWSLSLLSLLISIGAMLAIIYNISPMDKGSKTWVGEVSFSRRPPFPVPFDRVVPGMKLSEARATLAGGQMSSSLYIVEIGSGPFSHAAFGFWPEGEDPLIESVTFSFRDERAKQAVLQVALGTFGDFPHQSELLGTRLVWNNINGFRLTLDQMYTISRPRNAQAPNKGGRADG